MRFAFEPGSRVRVTAPAALRMNPPLVDRELEVLAANRLYVDFVTASGQELRIGWGALDRCDVRASREGF